MKTDERDQQREEWIAYYRRTDGDGTADANDCAPLDAAVHPAAQLFPHREQLHTNPR